MKLTSMKVAPAARAEAYPAPPMGDRPAYPWGLEITLDTSSLEALGLANDLPQVGKGMKLEAMVDVTRVSENDSAGGGKSCSVSLQITEMGLKPVKDTDTEDALYAGKK